MVSPHSSHPTLGAPLTQKLLFVGVKPGGATSPSSSHLTQLTGCRERENAAFVLERLLYLEKISYGTASVGVPWDVNMDQAENDAITLII